jgi:hypothetical protein
MRGIIRGCAGNRIIIIINFFSDNYILISRQDKQNLWCEAKIIACDLVTGKIKVHFNGWNSRHDLWTDPMGIAPHGKHTSKYYFVVKLKEHIFKHNCM